MTRPTTTEPWRAHQDTCAHYRGMGWVDERVHTCALGIAYESVAAPQTPAQARGGPRFAIYRRLPCVVENGVDTCDARHIPTDAEAQAEEAEIQASLAAYVGNLDQGRCPHCGAAIERERQVGQCVYAWPCGCRLYQGRAKEGSGR